MNTKFSVGFKSVPTRCFVFFFVFFLQRDVAMRHIATSHLKLEARDVQELLERVTAMTS